MAEGLKLQILTPYEIAEFVDVEPEQVFKWMVTDSIPYVELQDQGGEYRIPFHGFQSCMLDLFHLEEGGDGSVREPASDNPSSAAA